MRRRERGAALILFTVICLAAFASTLVAGAAFVKLIIVRQKSVLAVEAASLAAASDLSSLVVNDPNYGYIALSDFAPSSTKLMGEDGKPLPVTGINTILATARYNMLIGKHLNNQAFLELAQKDAENAREASKRLSRALTLALQEAPGAPLDKDGRVVKPLSHARKVLQENLAKVENIEVKQFDLALGTSPDVSSTTRLPLPLSLAEVSASASSSTFFPAFQNLPVADQDFVFYAVARQPALSPADKFQLPEKNSDKAASLVRASVKIKITDEKTFGLDGTQATACAMPYALNDCASSGTLVLGLPQGMPGGYVSIQDFLTDHRLSTRSAVYSATGGDYPADLEARLVAGQMPPMTRDIFAMGLYDFIRTTHGRARLDSVLETIGRRVGPSQGTFKPGQSLVYRLDKEGYIRTEDYQVQDMAKQVVHENQLYTLAWNVIPATNGSWNLSFRDQVRNLGPTLGGKHAGQLMESDGSYSQIGVDFGEAAASSHNEDERKSYFDGGLAVEFVLTGAQNIVSNF